MKSDGCDGCVSHILFRFQAHLAAMTSATLLSHLDIHSTAQCSSLNSCSIDPDFLHRCSPDVNILPQSAFRHILHRPEKRPRARKGVRFRDVGILEISRIGGFHHGGVVECHALEVVFQKGVVVLEDAVAEILEARVVGCAGEEGLTGGMVCRESISEAC